MEVFAVDKLAGREEAVPIEADATLSAVKRQCGEAFGFGDDVELSVGGQRVACDDGEAVSSIAAFSGGCRIQVERGVRKFVEDLRNGETTMGDIPLWARMRRECVLAMLERYCGGVKQQDGTVKAKAKGKRKGKKKTPFALHWVPPSLYDDKEVMQQLVKLRPECFSLASPALRRDADIVFASLKPTGHGPGSLPPDFPNREMCLSDKAFVLRALAGEKIALKDVSPTLRDDKDVVMMAMDHEFQCESDVYDDTLSSGMVRDAVSWGGTAMLTDLCHGGKLRYRDLSPALRGDKEVALHAIAADGVWLEFQYMSEELRGDKDVVLKAFRRRCHPSHVLQCMSEELRGDKDIFLEALYRLRRENSNYARDAVQCMSEDLRADKGLALEALENGASLQDVSMSLRGDKEVAMKAVQSNPREFQYLSEELRGDKEVAMLALESNRVPLLQHMSETLRGDKEVVLRAIKHDDSAYIHIAGALRDDRDIALRVVTEDNTTYFHTLPDVLRDDVQVALPAIRGDPLNFMYAGEHVRGDRQAALAAFAEESNTALLAFASADLQADREVALQAVRANPQNVSYASPALQPGLQEEAAV